MDNLGNINLRKIRKGSVRAFNKFSHLSDRKILAWARNSDGELSKEFKTWFKGSVLTSENGDPLLFYHGTSKEFEKFDSENIRELGFHFGAASTASDVAQNKDGGKIFPVVIRMKAPLRLTDIVSFSFENIQNICMGEITHNRCKNGDEMCKQYVASVFENVTTNENLLQALESFGFDGIIYRNEYESIGSGDSIIVFRPKQVRSATTGEKIWKE